MTAIASPITPYFFRKAINSLMNLWDLAREGVKVRELCSPGSFLRLPASLADILYSI
jgi:hypothetical protein